MARKYNLPLLLTPQFESHLKRHKNALRSISDKPSSSKKKVHSSHSRYLMDLQGIKHQLNRQLNQQKLKSSPIQKQQSQNKVQEQLKERVSINKKVICLEGIYFFNQTFLHQKKIQINLKNVQTKESFTLCIQRDHCTYLLNQHCSGDISRLNQLIKINLQGSPFIGFLQKDSPVCQQAKTQFKRYRSNLKINRPLNITLTGQANGEIGQTYQPQIRVRKIQRLREIHKQQYLEGRLERVKSFLPPMKLQLIPS